MLYGCFASMFCARHSSGFWPISKVRRRRPPFKPWPTCWAFATPSCSAWATYWCRWWHGQRRWRPPIGLAVGSQAGGSVRPGTRWRTSESCSSGRVPSFRCCTARFPICGAGGTPASARRGYAVIYLAHVFGLFLTGNGNARATFQVQLYGAVPVVLLGLPLACIWGTWRLRGLLVVNAAKCVTGGTQAFRLFRLGSVRPQAHDDVEVQLTA